MRVVIYCLRTVACKYLNNTSHPSMTSRQYTCSKLLLTFPTLHKRTEDWYICSDPAQRNTRCSGYESIWEGFSSVSGWFGKRLRLSQTIWRRQRSHMEADPAGTAVLAITRLNSLKRRSKPCYSSDQIAPGPFFVFYLQLSTSFVDLGPYRNHRITLFICWGSFIYLQPIS